MNSLATFIGSAWGGNLVSHMNHLTIHTNTQVSFYGPGEELVEGVDTASFPGTKTNSCMPANCAVAVSWKVAIGYRGGHPRSYLAGLDLNDVPSLAAISPALASTLAAGGNTFLNSINGHSQGPLTSLTVGTISFVRQKQWRTPPVFVAYTTATCDTRIDSQRRRLGRDIP